MTSIKKSSSNEPQFREFFYNKETPNYWKFFFFLLEKVFLKTLLGVIFIVTIYTIPAIIDSVSSHYMKYIEQKTIQKAQLEEKELQHRKDEIQKNKDERVYVKQLLTTLDNTVILQTIKNIYKEADIVHQKALENNKKEPNNRQTSRPGTINDNYTSLKKSLDEDLKNVLKVSAILELNNEGVSSQLTLTEIQQAIETIRQYTITGKLKNNRYYIDLKNVADAID